MATQPMFDVAIVGGGIVGAAIAAALASSGKSVAIIERARCGAVGATSLSGGIVRVFHSDPCITHLAHRAVHELQSTPIGRIVSETMNETGVLHVMAASHESLVNDAITEFSSVAYPIKLLSHADAARLTGFATKDEGKLYVWEPVGGQADAMLAVRALLAKVRSTGLVLEGQYVHSISGSLGDIEVRLRNSVIRSKVGVVAAGPWARALRPELPIVNRTIPFARFWTPQSLTFPVIDAVAGTYARPLNAHVVQAGSSIRTVDVPADCIPSASKREASDAKSRLLAMTGWTPSIELLGTEIGVDGYSSDGRPICGFLDEGGGIYASVAMCGIGYKLAPAIAAIATNDILAALSSGQHEEDSSLNYLRPSRFA